MCKLCGRKLGEDHVKVRMGGKERPLCSDCLGKDVPIMDRAPDIEVGGSARAIRVSPSVEHRRLRV
ncbi:MAG: hypothetical protein ABEJ62_00420 [Candidatus Nanohaloarchaea archaeon]